MSIILTRQYHSTVDNTIYVLIDGTRDLTGILSYDSDKSFTADYQIVDKKYVDTIVSTASGLPSVHNNLIGLQGGISGEYYHLSQTQHDSLTGSGVSTLHTHDDRYYTESEIDFLLTSISGTTDHSS